RVRSVDGGPAIDLPAGDAQIRHVSWRSDSRTILADGFHAQADWAMYDVVARTRSAFVARPSVARPFQGRDNADRGADTIDRDAYGPIAFAPDGRTVYVGMPNGGGTLDLRALPIEGGRARRLTSFSRDAYAPTVAADGTVLFKVQSYRTVVALAPATGGVVG